MFLNKLDIIQYKNLGCVTLSFSNKINCFIGNNGAGKTNALDSIYYLSMCKSAFGTSDRQLVMHEKDFFVITGQYKDNLSGYENINCSFKTNAGKKIKRNDKEYPKLVEHIGLIPVVIVTPYDSGIINESGEERRKYINQLISQIDKQYLTNVIKYNQLIAQRNILLKSKNQYDVLEIIDMQLSELGDKIHKVRKATIEKLAPIVQSYYDILCESKEQISISYTSKLNNQSMEQILKDTFEKDCINQHTTSGIHRDDIKMNIMDYPIRKYGSQGQQKSFIIALKLAQGDIIAEHTNKKPILILDDVFDKLDLNRVEGLLKIVSSDKFGQIFISDCNKQRLDNILQRVTDKYTIFKVENSNIEVCNEESQH